MRQQPKQVVESGNGIDPHESRDVPRYVGRDDVIEDDVFFSGIQRGAYFRIRTVIQIREKMAPYFLRVEQFRADRAERISRIRIFRNGIDVFEKTEAANFEFDFPAGEKLRIFRNFQTAGSGDQDLDPVSDFVEHALQKQSGIGDELEFVNEYEKLFPIGNLGSEKKREIFRGCEQGIPEFPVSRKKEGLRPVLLLLLLQIPEDGGLSHLSRSFEDENFPLSDPGLYLGDNFSINHRVCYKTQSIITNSVRKSMFLYPRST